VGRDSILHPGVTIEGRTVIGEDCVIRPGARLVECTLGRGVEILDHSVLTGSRVGDGAKVGPFAHLRPGAILGAHVKVGNFVEIKQSRLARGVKASHLSYLGDSVIGEESNIGAGTITCNYDGERKNRTRLGRRVFVGSDTQLVAPVTVGEGAYVGAGTTVTKDVPAGALAIGRAPQRTFEGGVARRKAKKRKGKAPRPA
jgi:bifunctional UDP-N-acetylglucosamine pyrophosphorylase/glucosamine-1-phosphate N-acetyltransferase